MKEFIPEKILYDPAVLSFPLGKKLMETYLPMKIPMEQIHAYVHSDIHENNMADYKEKKRSLMLRDGFMFLTPLPAARRFVCAVRFCKKAAMHPIYSSMLIENKS